MRWYQSLLLRHLLDLYTYTNNMILQVTENVLNHQTNKFARENDMDPETFTDTQRKEVRAAMLEEYYPGRANIQCQKNLNN